MNHEKEIKNIIDKSNLFRKEGKLDDAKNLLIDVLSYGELKDTIYYHLGIIYFEENDFDLALYAFKKTLELNTEHINAGYYLVKIYKKQKRFDRALTLYKNTWKRELGELKKDETRRSGIGMWINKLKGRQNG